MSLTDCYSIYKVLNLVYKCLPKHFECEFWRRLLMIREMFRTIFFFAFSLDNVHQENVNVEADSLDLSSSIHAIEI